MCPLPLLATAPRSIYQSTINFNSALATITPCPQNTTLVPSFFLVLARKCHSFGHCVSLITIVKAKSGRTLWLCRVQRSSTEPNFSNYSPCTRCLKDFLLLLFCFFSSLFSVLRRTIFYARCHWLRLHCMVVSGGISTVHNSAFIG